MSTTTFSEVRTDIAASVTGIGGDWNLALTPFALHGPNDVPDAIPASKAHLSFSVGLSSERGIAGEVDRQRVSEGTLTTSLVTVRFFARARGGVDSITDEDAALDHEHALIKAVIATSTDFQTLWVGSTRSMVTSGEWFVHEVLFTVIHRLPLT